MTIADLQYERENSVNNASPRPRLGIGNFWQLERESLINISSAPSGEEWYYRRAEELQEVHPEWSKEQITQALSIEIWNNNYHALIDDIAHSVTPEEREQKIRDHQVELNNYRSSGVNVDNDIQHLRDTQGMGSVVISGAEWYDREWRKIKAETGWADELVTVEMTRRIEKIEYDIFIKDIANKSPEERERKIWDHTSDIDRFKRAGYDVDGHIAYLRVAQGMPVEEFSQSVDIDYVLPPNSFLYADDLDETNLAAIRLPSIDDAYKLYNTTKGQLEKGIEELHGTPNWNLAMGWMHGLVGQDGKYDDRSADYQFGYNIGNNAVRKLLNAADKVIETAPPILPGRGPTLSSEVVIGGTIPRLATSSIPYNIFFSSAKENVSSESNEAHRGPVEVKPPPNATPEQIEQVKRYVEGANRALKDGALSPTGRVSTKGELRRQASRAAQKESRRATGEGTPYEGHVGHVPDTTWTGTPEPHSWLKLDPNVNTSIGGQANKYPLGYKPTEFIYKGGDIVE